MDRNNSETRPNEKSSLSNDELRLSAFESIFSSPDRGVILLNSCGKIVDSNTIARAIFNINEDTDDLSNIESSFTFSDDEFTKKISMALQKKTDLALEGFCEQQMKWFRISISTFENGSMLFVKDITKQREQQKEIEELARFPEETWNPVMKFNIDGKIVYTNSRCDAILDSWNTHLNGQLPEDVSAVVRKSITSNTTQEVEVLCKNQQIYSILLAPVPQANATYVYGRDVTKLKENEQELLAHRDHLEELVSSRTVALETSRDEAERANKAKSIFLANMSHEIRTPLAAIIGFSESLLGNDQTEDEKKKSISTIIRSGNHLKNIVNNILDISKIEAEKIELETLEVNIFEILSDIHSLINTETREKGLDFIIDYDYPLPVHITTDPVRLKQILINLCNNAIKFTKKGSITIKVSSEPENELALFRIIDTGIGLNKSQQEKIFQPFTQADSSTTRKFGGTGLGLTLSKQFASLLGGELTVNSEKNKGSEFKLTVSTGKLDRSTFTTTCTHITETGSHDIVESCNNLQGQVLLAEDTPDLQALTSFIIRKTGATVCVVGNGKDAVKEALKNDYDIIFMDIHMPVMDGYEAVKTLRKQNYNKPIIAMTANTMKEDRDNAHRAGCDGFVGKPINRNELYSILKQNLKLSDETQNELPLSSSLLDEEPELVDLVQKFINNMPELIQQYRTSYNNKNWKQLKEDIHVLKALGGGHGYQDITNTALHIEQCITSNEYETIEQHLTRLDILTMRAAALLFK